MGDAEGHIGDKQRMGPRPSDSAGVVAHHLKRHGYRRLEAELRRPDRITDQDQIDPGLIGVARDHRIVGGHRHQRTLSFGLNDCLSGYFHRFDPLKLIVSLKSHESPEANQKLHATLLL